MDLKKFNGAAILHGSFNTESRANTAIDGVTAFSEVALFEDLWTSTKFYPLSFQSATLRALSSSC